jgi:hypothetical protein
MHGEAVQSACPDGYLTEQKRPTLCLCAGVGLGLVAALLSWGIGFAPSGHQLNDPIPLGLAISNLPRGLLYFDWSGLAQALEFPIGIGLLSWFLLRELTRWKNL